MTNPKTVANELNIYLSDKTFSDSEKLVQAQLSIKSEINGNLITIANSDKNQLSVEVSERGIKKDELMRLIEILEETVLNVEVEGEIPDEEYIEEKIKVTAELPN